MINSTMLTIAFRSTLLVLFLMHLLPNPSEAAVAFRSKTFKTSGSVSSVTTTEPAGAAQNDILFMFIVHNNNLGITGPTGWTSLTSFLTTNGVYVRLYWIRRGASAPSYSFTLSGTTTYYEVSVTAWTGVVTSGNPYDVYAVSATTQRNPPMPN